MDMPDDGSTGCWTGRRPEGEPAALHLRELGLFLSVHLGRAPGILWPEYDHPALVEGPGACDPELVNAQLGLLTTQLGCLTGLSARTVAVDTADGGGGATRAVRPGAGSGDHLLVHQIAGAGSWRLSRTRTTAAAEPGPTSFACRLRPGEVLYVPAHWSRRAEFTAGARYAVTRLWAPTG
ncbi:hypothetical protein ACIGQE_19010 [Streptomyces sp. NPDC053429]|uniref:hypothetical protein n=1 Tax=Streptomyces sp. NPDC053429 TaxID=3365702 RepID=UPI0037D744ED